MEVEKAAKQQAWLAEQKAAVAADMVNVQHLGSATGKKLTYSELKAVKHEQLRKKLAFDDAMKARKMKKMDMEKAARQKAFIDEKLAKRKHREQLEAKKKAKMQAYLEKKKGLTK